MPRSAIASFLERLDRALDADCVFTTREARDVALDQFSWDEGEIFSLLRVLEEEDFHLADPSTAEEGGMIWVFVQMTNEGRVWIRLCERQHMVVVSFHRG